MNGVLSSLFHAIPADIPPVHHSKGLCFGDLTFQRNIFSNHISCPIQKKCGKKPAHSSVSVVERMNAEKIMDENGNQNESIHLLVIHHTIKIPTDGVNGLGCLIG